jgi:hypothetical protein
MQTDIVTLADGVVRASTSRPPQAFPDATPSVDGFREAKAKLVRKKQELKDKLEPPRKTRTA